MPSRAALRSGVTLCFALTLLLGSAAWAQQVRVVRTSPAEQTAQPGATVTHVFALYGEGQVRPRLHSERGWPLLTSPRTLTLKGAEPVYFPVTLRVPEGAPAGTRDRLTVEANGARAEAATVVAYVPGLEARWPREVEFVPPLSYLPLDLRNAGNGPDVFLVRLESLEGDPIFTARVSLAAGEERKLQLPLSSFETCRLQIRSLRGGEQRVGLVIPKLSHTQADGGFRLLGRLGAAYGYPDAFSLSASMAGPLSDFAYLNFGIGYALGTLPAGNLSLSFSGGYFSLAYGPSYGLALGLQEDGTAVALSLSGPEPRGSFNLDFDSGPASYGLSASLARDPSFNLNARVNLHARASDLLAGFQSDALRVSFTLHPTATRIYGDLGYGFRHQDWPINLYYGFDWQVGALPNHTLSADANPRPISLGGRLSWTGNGVGDWALSLASSSERLQLNVPLPISFGLSAGPGKLQAFAGATLDLPQPWSDLSGQAEFDYDDGTWAFTVTATSQASSLEGLALWDVGGQLGWPLSENELSLGIRSGGSYLRGHAYMDWSPWKPALSTRLGLQLFAGGTVLRAGLTRDWYAQSTQFSLSADMPLILEVPPRVTELFGGRRVGTVRGIVSVDGPDRFRKGIPIRAGTAKTLTDVDGRFELQLPPGEYLVEIDKAQLPAALVAIKEAAEVRLEAKETVTVELSVAVRAALQGQVKVEGRKPDQPIRFAVALRDAQGHETSLYTDANGTFFVPGLRPGIYTVRLLDNLLPPGWKAVTKEASVRLEPGQTGEATLAVAPPPPNVYKGGIQILSVEPEAQAFPPGAAPLVTAEIEGEAQRVVLESNGRLLGVLLPQGNGIWSGRVKLPEDRTGTLQINVLARGGGQEARYPFFLALDPKAPWGVVRTLPVVQPGQEVPVLVHWYAPVQNCWLVVGDRRIQLSGSGGDFKGSFTVPDTASERLKIQASARGLNGEELKLERYLLVR